MKYEKPMITKLNTGIMNKFGRNPAYFRSVRNTIDGVSIDHLVENFGSPLYVFSERKIRKAIRDAKQSFTTRYPDVIFGWSYKTNYLDSICKIMHQEGSLAEVVSEFEYEKARATGMPGKDIIFNGPYKPKKALQKAASEGARIHIDHYEEIYDLESLEVNEPINIALRLNLDTGSAPQWSRFGFNLENGQALDAVKRIVTGKKMTLNGIHCHIGTFILDPGAYEQQMKKMLEFKYQIEDSFGLKIEYLDIGGGFPSKSKLKGTYLSPDLTVPSIDDFAERITGALFKHLRPGDRPTLILETGRGLIDEAGYMITTVFASKRLPDGKKAYIIDAGVNLLFTSFWYKFKLELDRELPGVNENSVIYGPLCMNIDVVDEGVMLPALPRGTRIIASPVGAYNVTQSMQFIQYRPNVVLIGPNAQVDLIQRSENIEDMTRRELRPDRLQDEIPPQQGANP